MPIKNREYFNRKAEKHGDYYLRFYPGGGFNLWKPGWKSRGRYVPPPKFLRERYAREEKAGKISESLRTYLGFYGVLACGKRSQPEGRKYLGLPLRKLGSKEDCKKTISQYWRPRKNKSGYFCPTQNQGKNVTAFMSSHMDVYKYAARHLKGFKKAVDKWYPGLYHKICARRPQRVTLGNEDELSLELIERFNGGLCIASTYLQLAIDPQERELRRRVMDCRKKDLLGKKETYTEIVHRLTHLPAKDIHLGKGVQKNCGELTEGFTEFLFYWSSMLGLDTWGIDSRDWINDHKNALCFSNGEKQYRADLRIGNKAIEVKTGIAKFSKERKNEIVRKYGNHGVWQTGEDVEKGAVIFHARTELYEHFFPSIQAAGLEIITYEDFHSHLIKVIEEMKNKSSMYRDVRPLTSLDYLVNLHEEVSLHPFLLIREENALRREWSQDILGALIERAQGLRNKNLRRIL